MLRARGGEKACHCHSSEQEGVTDLGGTCGSSAVTLKEGSLAMNMAKEIIGNPSPL
jgi:hypothetical protein